MKHLTAFVSTFLCAAVLLASGGNVTETGQGGTRPAHKAVAENKAPSVIGCPAERYPVRTGKDYDANLIDLSSFTFTTVAAMRSWPAPSFIPEANRISPYETTVLVLDATLVEYQLDRDSDNSDYQLTLADELGNTITARIPSWTCAAFEDREDEPGSQLPQSRFLAGIEIARDEFAARLSPTTTAQSANIRVRIMGIGMFDDLRGITTGEAPNGIELSPVMSILFDDTRMPITRVPIAHHLHDARLTDPR